MSKRDPAWAKQIDQGLSQFATRQTVPGIRDAATRKVLVEQFVESIHRVEYVTEISRRRLSPKRLDPSSGLYDPIRAAVILRLQGQLDEAFWQTFLSVHFGKNGRTGWRLAATSMVPLGKEFVGIGQPQVRTRENSVRGCNQTKMGLSKTEGSSVIIESTSA